MRPGRLNKKKRGGLAPLRSNPDKAIPELPDVSFPSVEFRRFAQVLRKAADGSQPGHVTKQDVGPASDHNILL